MDKSELIEPVFVGKISMLHKAARLLEEHGVKCRHSSPNRASGILRVARPYAETARSLLERLDAEGVVSAQEAALFFCPKCDVRLPSGAVRCPECDEFVGDPHAM